MSISHSDSADKEVVGKSDEETKSPATRSLEVFLDSSKKNYIATNSQLTNLEFEFTNIDRKRKYHFGEWEQKLKLKKSNDSDLALNIGGKLININRKLVDLHSREIMFFALISGKYDHLLMRDRHDRIFLDLDFKWVQPVINLARDLTMWDGVDEKSKPKIRCDPQYLFGADLINKSIHNDQQSQSFILQSLQHINFYDVLSSWFPSPKKHFTMKLLFRGSRDGFTAKSFHDNCDDQKDTISLIRDTKGCVFGGFTDVAWTSQSKSFLFSLRKNSVENATQYKIRPGREGYSVCHQSENMFSFGGSDLFILNMCNLSDTHMCNLSKKLSYSRGNMYELAGTLSLEESFTVQEIEVFKLDFSDSPSLFPLLTVQPVEEPIVYAEPTLFGAYFQESLKAMKDMMSELKNKEDAVKTAENALLYEVIAYKNELNYVATFADVELLSVKRGSTVMAETVDNVIDEIAAIVALLTSDRAVAINDTSSSMIVYINVAGEEVVAVTKDNLLHSSSGSILANMASDVWGHDLDSDGNIIQDVNPELFRLIIAHLRRKILLQREDRMSEVPPISVYQDQKSAMENLLAFYAMSDDVTLKVV